MPDVAGTHAISTPHHARFYYGIHTTRNNFKMKRRFYQKFTKVGIVWLLYIPVLALLGRWVGDAHRDFWITLCELVYVALGQVRRARRTRRTTRRSRNERR
jgi:hypothetical protein